MSRLLRLPAVSAKTGLSTTEIYTRQAKGKFPHSVALGPRMVAWVEDEIDLWNEQRIKERDASPERTREQRKRRAGPGRGHKGPIKTNNPSVSGEL
jgi:prophage regulatory protein